MNMFSCSFGSSLTYFNNILCILECKLCTSKVKLVAILLFLNFPCVRVLYVVVHAHSCACKARSQRRTSGVLRHRSPPHSSETRSLTESGAVSHCVSHLHPHSAEVTGVHTPYSQLLMWVLGICVLLLTELSLWLPFYYF